MKRQFHVFLIALSISAAMVSCKSDGPSESEPGYYFTVTSLDEWGNESAISNVILNETITTPVPQTPATMAHEMTRTRYALNRANCQSLKGAAPNVLRIKLKPGTRVSGASADGSRVGVAEVDALTALYPGAKYQRVFTSSAKTEARHRAAGLDLWYTVVFDESSAPDLGTAVAGYDALSQVEYVETVRPMIVTEERLGAKNVSASVSGSSVSSRATDLPFNDPELKMQWHYDNLGIDYGEIKVNPRANVNVFKAWEKSTGDRDVIVAITDQGVDYNHEDLKAVMWVNEGEIADNGIDDDGNGFIDDVHGYNFGVKMKEDGSWPQPPYVAVGKIEPGSHGTHVAGTVGAINNNGKGVCGIAGGGADGQGGVRLMCVEIFSGDGAADGSLIADAAVYAADNGAIISQNSWSMVPDEWSAAIEESYIYFATNAGNKEMFPNSPMQGGVTFVSAGNNNNDLIGDPARFASSITVASISHLRKKSDHSCFGPLVSLSAPGGNYGGSSYLGSEVLGVYSTDLNNGYVAKSGTSMASPHVSGIAALYISQNKGSVTPEQVRNRILSSCADLSDTDENHRHMGRGLIDAAKAVRLNDNSAPKAVTNLALIEHNGVYTLSWSIPSDESDIVASYKVYYSKVPITDASIANLKSLRGQYEGEPGKNQKHVIKLS